MRDAITPTDLSEVLHKLRDQALDGDTAAARVLLERCLGKPRTEEAPISIELPDLDDAAGLATAMRRIARAVASGDVGVEDGARMAAILKSVSEATVVVDLSEQVEQLRSAQQQGGHR